jgi:hypothetical protein
MPPLPPPPRPEPVPEAQAVREALERWNVTDRDPFLYRETRYDGLSLLPPRAPRYDDIGWVDREVEVTVVFRVRITRETP